MWSVVRDGASGQPRVPCVGRADAAKYVAARCLAPGTFGVRVGVNVGAMVAFMVGAQPLVGSQVGLRVGSVVGSGQVSHKGRSRGWAWGAIS